MPIYVVIDPAEDEDDGLYVEAPTARAAAEMVVGPGPYNWVNKQIPWRGSAGIKLTVKDQDGSEFECRVYGPFL